MADVSTWSPTDESNTSPPPDGFPEYMLPSALNNSSRAVMGAVRRMYDQLLAGSGSGGVVLPYLPVSGGTVSGGTTFNGGITTTNVSASGTVSGAAVSATSVTATNALYVASGNQVVADYNGISYFGSNRIAFTWDGRAQVWVDHSRQGHIAIADDNNNLTLSGISGTLYGGVQAGGNNVISSGTIQGGYIHSTGSFDASGNVTAGGTIQGGYVHSAGDIRADGVTYVSSIVGNYSNNGIACATHIFPQNDGGGYCGMAAWAWAGVEAYAYYTKSDARVKTDISGDLPECLDLVRQIQPKRYRLTNVADDTREHWGFIAQDIAAVMGSDFGGYRPANSDEERDALSYNDLTAMLWQAVRELAAEVKTLKAGA